MLQPLFSFHVLRLQPGCVLSTRRDSGLACLTGTLRQLLAASLLLQAQAQAQPEPVYRCGQTYTNAPSAGQLCERLPEQRVTVIEGTRVQRPTARSAAEAAGPGREVKGTGLSGGQGEDHRQADRQSQARAVLLDELARTRERHAQLQRELASLQTPAAETPRAHALQQQLARSQRDLQSLQRELERLHPEGRR